MKYNSNEYTFTFFKVTLINMAASKPRGKLKNEKKFILFILFLIKFYKQKIKAKPCDRNPCKSRGVCINGKGNSYLCKCFAGYKGKNCEKSKNGQCQMEREFRKKDDHINLKIFLKK